MTITPHRILSQKVGDRFEAWYFDGVNQVGDRAQGNTREQAIAELQERSERQKTGTWDSRFEDWYAKQNE